MMHPVSSYIITAYVTSSVFYSSREVNVTVLTMECLQTNSSSTASAFENNELAYIHCVSKENFGNTLKGFTCVSLICREVHVSFVETMDERRRAVVPVTEFVYRWFIFRNKKSRADSNQFFLWYHGKFLVFCDIWSKLSLDSGLFCTRSTAKNVTHHMHVATQMCDISKIKS